MKRTVRLASVLVTMLTGSFAFAGGHDLPLYDAYFDALDAQARPLSSAAVSPAMLAGVSSIDEKRGVPTLYWAPANGPMVPAEYLARPDASARFYLEHYAALYGLGSGALASAYVAMVHDTGRGGIIVVFRQKAAGIDVHQVAVKVLMTRSHELVAITGNLHPRAAAKMTRSAKFLQTPQMAISRAFNDFFATNVPASVFEDTRHPEHGYSFYSMEDTAETITKNIGLARPARIKKVYFAMPDALVPAYYVEIAGAVKTSTSSVLYSYVMAADDGRMLQRRSLTQEAAFQYRVWSDGMPNFTPKDGPQVDFTPHPTGFPDGSAPAFSLPTMVTVDGFNKNPMNTFDPWLAAGANQTLGNNVDAYVDRNAPDGFGGMDFRATTTSAGVFERTYDTAQSPTVNQNQQRASIAQLFYNNNYYHDYWYDSGFNEAAGNAQSNNFGRGGAGNDLIKAEGQDYSGTDNANMQTPADGSSPIMQMYVFSGVGNTSLTVNPGNTTYPVGVADFGAQAFTIGPAQIVAAVDNSMVDSGGGNTGTFADACQALTGGAGTYTGKIVLADRGACNFTVKVKNIQNAGGVGAIIANNAVGLPPNPMAGMDNTITIGTLGVSQDTGTVLRQKIQMGMITGTLVRGPALQRDGTIDGGIVGHEWGHYFHQRLSSPGTQQGGAMGEGWGDFQAMMQIVHPDDNTGASFSGVFATGIYASATFGDSGYYGIRRAPYSKDFMKNGLTFKHIGDAATLPAGVLDFGTNSEVHNAGEVWCQMLWEGYSNLLDDTLGAGARHTFDQAKRKMADYLVGGLKLAPGNMTYTEQRDGILVSAIAAGKVSGDYRDFQDLAAGFATRGAGKCAVSPARNSTTLDGVVESFTANPEPAFVSAVLTDTMPSCDNDGILDAGETGTVAITIQNTGWADLTGATVTVTSSDPNLTFPNGNSAMVPTTAVFANGVANVDVALSKSVNAVSVIPLNIVINAATACTTTVNTTGSAEVHFDSLEPNTANAETTETFEGLTKTWKASIASGGSTQLWSIARPVAMGTNEMIWGQDIDGVSDHRYESPDLVVGAGPFSMTFQNRYEFELSMNTNWDGAVVEYSEDGGMTWADVNTLAGVNPGYTGAIDNTGGNPLGGRQGYTGATAGFANGTMVARTVNFGTTLANKTVKLRFRIGNDELQGAGGWYIDDIAFTGLTNKPFSVQVVDSGMCENMPPIANAGVDQVVPSGANVALDGTASSDPDNAPSPLTFAWTQPVGPGVSLSMNMGSTTNFVAPNVMMDTLLTFQLTVNDGAATASDTVDVLVQAKGGSGSGGAGGMGTGGSATGGNGGTAEGGAGGSRPPVLDDGGCGCSVPGSEDSTPLRNAGGSLLALFGAWLVRRRRNGKPS